MDGLIKALSRDKRIHYVVVSAPGLVRESMQRLDAWPPATVHLGQALMASVLLRAITSKETFGKLTLQWSVDGPFGHLYAEADALGQARGTVLRPRAGQADGLSSLGKGILQVRRLASTTATGIVESGGDVCTDVLTYLHQSEQRRCAMNLWVDLHWDATNPSNPIVVRKALGYLIELLPEDSRLQTDARALALEERLAELGGLSKWIIGDEDPRADVLRTLSGESEAQELGFQEIRFHCTCTEERAKRALVLAQRQGLEEPEAGQDHELIRCEFCGKTYKI